MKKKSRIVLILVIAVVAVVGTSVTYLYFNSSNFNVSNNVVRDNLRDIPNAPVVSMPSKRIVIDSAATNQVYIRSIGTLAITAGDLQVYANEVSVTCAAGSTAFPWAPGSTGLCVLPVGSTCTGTTTIKVMTPQSTDKLIC